MRGRYRGSAQQSHFARRLSLAMAVLGLCAVPVVLVAQTEPATSTVLPTPSAPTAPPVPQTASTPPDASTPAMSPAGMYKQAMHPLEVVRSSLAIWSDAELGALGVGMHMAAADCGQTKPELYKGDDLFNPRAALRLWSGLERREYGGPRLSGES